MAGQKGPAMPLTDRQNSAVARLGRIVAAEVLLRLHVGARAAAMAAPAVARIAVAAALVVVAVLLVALGRWLRLGLRAGDEGRQALVAGEVAGLLLLRLLMLLRLLLRVMRLLLRLRLILLMLRPVLIRLLLLIRLRLFPLLIAVMLLVELLRLSLLRLPLLRLSLLRLSLLRLSLLRLPLVGLIIVAVVKSAVGVVLGVWHLLRLVVGVLLTQLLLRGRDQTEVVLGVLVVVLRRHMVAGGGRVARELEIFLDHVMRGATDLHLRPVRLVNATQRVVVMLVVMTAVVSLVTIASAHALILTVSHGLPCCRLPFNL